MQKLSFLTENIGMERNDFWKGKRQMMTGIRVLLAMALFGLTGCAVVGSSQVDPSTIYTSYRATYDERTRQLEYEASFQVGNGFGTYVSLDGGSEVRVDENSLRMETTILNQVSYTQKTEVQDLSQLQRDHVFTFKNANCQGQACSGQTYRNSFRVRAPGAIAAWQNRKVALWRSFVVSWTLPEAVQPHERIYAVIRKVGTTGHEQEAWESAGSPRGTSGTVEFSSQDLANLGPGPAELWICREQYFSEIQAPAAGGDLTVRSCSRSIEISIE